MSNKLLGISKRMESTAGLGQTAMERIEMRLQGNTVGMSRGNFGQRTTGSMMRQWNYPEYERKMPNAEVGATYNNNGVFYKKFDSEWVRFGGVLDSLVVVGYSSGEADDVFSPTNLQQPMIPNYFQHFPNNNNIGFHFVGPALIASGLPLIPKNSSFAKAIFPRSAAVMGARSNTSLASLVSRRISTRFGLSFIGGQIARKIPYIGWGITFIDLASPGYHSFSRTYEEIHGITPVDNVRVVRQPYFEPIKITLIYQPQYYFEPWKRR